MEQKTQFPILKWAQRKGLLFITINVVPVKPPVVDITDGKILKYSGTDGVKNYAFEIELYDEVIKEESKYTLDSRNAFLKIKKKTTGPHWPRLTKDAAKYQWIQIDWASYVDEDEETEENQPDFEGQDFGTGELDEDDEVPEPHDGCGCGHEHGHEHSHKEEEKKDEEKKEEKKKEEEKKPDLSDLDKEEQK